MVMETINNPLHHNLILHQVQHHHLLHHNLIQILKIHLIQINLRNHLFYKILLKDLSVRISLLKMLVPTDMSIINGEVINRLYHQSNVY